MNHHLSSCFHLHISSYIYIILHNNCDFFVYHGIPKKCPIFRHLWSSRSYPLVSQHSYWKMAIEIVDFPMKNGGSFHSYVTVYQRVLHPGPPGPPRHGPGGTVSGEALHRPLRLLLGRVNEETCATTGATGVEEVPLWWTKKSHGKSPFLIGKSTINGPFSIAMLNYQRVFVEFNHQMIAFGVEILGFFLRILGSSLEMMHNSNVDVMCPFIQPPFRS